jgi:hypothetical protein
LVEGDDSTTGIGHTADYDLFRFVERELVPEGWMIRLDVPNTEQAQELVGAKDEGDKTEPECKLASLLNQSA